MHREIQASQYMTNLKDLDRNSTLAESCLVIHYPVCYTVDSALQYSLRYLINNSSARMISRYCNDARTVLFDLRPRAENYDLNRLKWLT